MHNCVLLTKFLNPPEQKHITDNFCSMVLLRGPRSKATEVPSTTAFRTSLKTRYDPLAPVHGRGNDSSSVPRQPALCRRLTGQPGEPLPKSQAAAGYRKGRSEPSSSSAAAAGLSSAERARRARGQRPVTGIPTDRNGPAARRYL